MSASADPHAVTFRSEFFSLPLAVTPWVANRLDRCYHTTPISYEMMEGSIVFRLCNWSSQAVFLHVSHGLSAKHRRARSWKAGHADGGRTIWEVGVSEDNQRVRSRVRKSRIRRLFLGRECSFPRRERITINFQPFRVCFVTLGGLIHFSIDCRKFNCLKLGSMALDTLRDSLDNTWPLDGHSPSGAGARAQAWPGRLSGRLVWDGSKPQTLDDFTLFLSEVEVSEVCTALTYFHGRGLYGSDVSRRNFPLPTLGPKLDSVAVEIHAGRGFALIRGLPPDRFSHEDNVVIYLGISSYIAPVRGRQDEDGHMLTHICDSKKSRTSQEERPTKYSRRASTFHTDAHCDVLALQTRNCAAEGGRNLLASSWTVYNKIAARHPELIKVLAAPIWPFDSHSKLFESTTRPLLYLEDGRVILNFSREPLLGLAGVNRHSDLPHLAPSQKATLDCIEEIARESQLAIDAWPGDLLFINNHGVLHSREAFRDSPETSRYLIRLWLKHPKLAWKMPKELQDFNDRIYRCPELGRRWSLVDVPKTGFRLSERLTT